MSKHCWTLKDRFESQFSAAFYPILLSDTKRAEIIHRAEEIRAVRNDISEIFFSDMLGFQDMTKFEAFNFFNPTFTTRLSSHYLKKSIEDVWKAYQLRYDAIQFYLGLHFLQSIQNLVAEEEGGVLGNTALISRCPNRHTVHHTMHIAEIGIKRQLGSMEDGAGRIGE